MRIVHRFYDLFVGGAEVVVLNTVKSLPDHEHVLLFSRMTKNWIVDELKELSHVKLVQVERGKETRTICEQAADLHCFHYYPPMNESEFRDLPPRVVNRSLLINHWYKEVPLVHGLRYIFLSEESKRRTGANVPSKLRSVLFNPVADKFFRVERQVVPASVGRHSRDADFKFPDDFFGLHESIWPGKLNVMVLGAPKNMQQFVQSELPQLKNNYWLFAFGTLRVPEFLRLPQIYLYQTRDDFAETCPMNILEAMAVGIPVVAEAKGGITSLINHKETGLLCTSAREFVESTQSLLENPELARTLAIAGREWVHENASVEKFGDRFLSVANELLAVTA